jgi:hypothetical protein
MNTTPRASPYRDRIVTAISMVILLVGMATGNALAMMGMAIVALVVITLVYRQTSNRMTLLTIAGALSVAFVFAVTVSLWLGIT